MKNVLSAILLFLTGGLLPVCGQSMRNISDIPLRDPYIVADAKSGYYYMYYSSSIDGVGSVEACKSKDLKNWEAPIRVFTAPADNWATGVVWAPEVHAYKGKYYLFATMNSDLEWKKALKGWPKYTFRGTQLFVSKNPEGPFLPMGKTPHTPMDQMALDGTLWVEDGRPYMVYCQEWVQTVDGKMVLQELKPDLSGPKGSQLTLFHASAASWSTGSAPGDFPFTSYVTDGCFLYRTKTGKLLMIWSSYMHGQYAIGIAESVTGKVSGPWKQQPQPLFIKDGGHGMIFKTFDGRLCLTFHQPNWPGGKERAHIFEIEDKGETLGLLGELFQECYTNK